MAVPPLKGTVKARKCPCCGHHEIGVEDAHGEFTALTPGMQVVIQQTVADSDTASNPENRTGR